MGGGGMAGRLEDGEGHPQGVPLRQPVDLDLEADSLALRDRYWLIYLQPDTDSRQRLGGGVRRERVEQWDGDQQRQRGEREASEPGPAAALPLREGQASTR